MKVVLRFLAKYVEQILLYLFMFVLSGSVTLQIVTRLLNCSFSWTEEVARYSFVWFALIGVSYAIQQRKHVGIGLIAGWIRSPKWKRVYETVIDLISLIVLGYLFVLCVRYIGFAHMKRTPALQVSMTVLNLSGVIGIGLAFIRTAQGVVLRFLHGRGENGEVRAE